MTKTKLKKDLKRIIEDIKPYDPEKIILYGSCARGDFRENSDIDLLIIKDTRENAFDRIGKILDLVYKKKYFLKGKLPGPLEVLVYTPKELEKRINLGDFFIKDILKEGKIIYEKQQ